MLDNLEDNLMMLISYSISDAKNTMRKQDEKYNKNSRRMSAIREELENIIESNEAPSQRHLDLINEYFDLDALTYYSENSSVYFQAIADFIYILTQLEKFKV